MDSISHKRCFGISKVVFISSCGLAPSNHLSQSETKQTKYSEDYTWTHRKKTPFAVCSDWQFGRLIGIQLRLKCIARRRVAMTINNNHNAKKSSDKHLNYYKHSNWRTDGGQSHMAHIDLCWLDTIMLNPTNHNWSITLCWIFAGLCYFDLYIHSGILKISRQVSQYWKGRTSCHELMWQLTVISHIRLHCLIILKSDSSSKRITYIQCSENHTA